MQKAESRRQTPEAQALVCFALKEEAAPFRKIAAGKFREIAEYCLRDVRATVELYKIWQERLAGIK